MSGGSGIKDDLREHYTLLPAGTVLWYVYPSRYEPHAFNPKSRNRFAMPPPPDRGMFFAADSSDLVIEDRQPQHIDPGLLEGRSMAQIKLTHEIPMLDLRAPHFRHLSTDPARHAEWQRLCVVLWSNAHCRTGVIECSSAGGRSVMALASNHRAHGLRFLFSSAQASCRIRVD
jgi:hypothetical protein